MNKSVVLIFVIIGTMVIFGFASSSDDINEGEVADTIIECMQHVITATDDVRNSLAQADREARLKHLEELGYPDGYDPTNPIANGEITEEDWYAIQQEEAMRSLAEDAMNDYYQERPDISDHVLKLELSN